MDFLNSFLARVANSMKIRAGTPLDIRNRIEEAFFVKELSEKAVSDINSFIEIIQNSQRSYDIKYFSKLRDGCYPLLSKYEYSRTLTISVGVGNNILLDLALSKLGSEVHMFDHTVDPPAKRLLNKNNFIFHSFGLGPESQNCLLSLTDIVSLVKKKSALNRMAVLKMDCEGCEWQSLYSSSGSIISLFDQFIVEFHHLNSFTNPEFAARAIDVLQKITKTFDVAYISANNFGGSVDVGGVGTWPFTIEVLFVKRGLSDLHLKAESANLPELKNWKLGKSIKLASWTKG